MPNGKAIIVKIALLIGWLASGYCGFGQVKDTSRFNSDYPSFKIDSECKTKSERTAKPTIIKISREKLALVKTVKDLIKDIPETCEIRCLFCSVKKQDDKVFEFINIGNIMVYADRLTSGKYIVIENLATSCPGLHKANYKIMIE